MKRIPLTLVALATFVLLPACAQNNMPPKTDPPRTWIDKDTGHRVIRLTDEPNSSAFYFNVNEFTPDGKQMVYTAPDGIHVLDLETRKTKLLVPNPPHAADVEPGAFRNNVHTIVVGSKTNSVFFTKLDTDTKQAILYKADVYTGEITKLIPLPPRAGITTINADETLGVGTYEEQPAPENQEYGHNAPQQAGNNSGANTQERAPLLQPESKGQMMERRLAARIPIVLFEINLRTGKMTALLHSTDWINHMLFSPTDPTLLMYCHEGPWQKVDRLWTIRTDGTHNTLIHKRTMAMEIAGHEFWGLDGKTIWYDWQYPKGEDFFLASYNLETHERTAYHMQRNEWSIHFNLTADLSLFTGDGGDPGQVAKAPDGEWIELFHPQKLPIGPDVMNAPDFWQPGVFHSEHLINMSHHNYRLEPNVRFTPDKKLVVFTTNMFGVTYVLGVEVDKAQNPDPSEVHSTPELASQFNPVNPTPTH